MSKVIYASFRDPLSAEKAVGALLDHGVRKEDVSVISSHEGTIPFRADDERENREDNTGLAYEPMFGYNAALGAVAVPPVYTDIPARAMPAGTGQSVDDEGLTEMQRRETERNYNDNTTSMGKEVPVEVYNDTASDTENAAKSGISTTTGADAGEGAVKGTAWGAGVGIIAGLASLIVPGVGFVYGGGALAIAIAGAVGATAAGAVAGAVTGYLVDQGVDAHVAEEYQRTIDNGGALVAVMCPSGSVTDENTQYLLEKYGAFSINWSQRKGYVL